VIDHFTENLRKAAFYVAAIGSVNLLGFASPNPAFSRLGSWASSATTPALHSPLMSVTNAVSGITAAGALHLMGGDFMRQNSEAFVVLLKKTKNVFF
jgi:NAD(P) transhydrogenase